MYIYIVQTYMYMYTYILAYYSGIVCCYVPLTLYMYTMHVQLAAKVSALQQQIVEIERQKQMVHEYLFSNNEAVTRVQKEVKNSTASEFTTFLSVGGS